ncbi:MAG: ECF transporter S component [Clostridiales bacterium]|jgi:hypothetical protein|nr:ECF transporter S component [Clostridiales bacterium]
MQKSIKRLAFSALFLALAIIFQNLRILPFIGASTPQSLFIIGSLVNLVLVITVLYCGVFDACVIGIITPIVAAFQGHLPSIALFPIVALGNCMLPLVIDVCKRKLYLGVILGSILKTIFLYFTMINISKLLLPAKAQALIAYNFSWPQLVTALIGGFLAIYLVKKLPKIDVNNKDKA